MSENRRILLVEDDSSLGYLLSEYLSMKSFEVVWAKNGVEALKEMEKRIFDLAVLDVMMPEMDGFTLAKKMQERHIGIPFLFLTSRSMKVDVLKGFALGAVDYLKKPIDEEELVPEDDDDVVAHQAPFHDPNTGRASPMRYVHGAPLHNVLEEEEEE